MAKTAKQKLERLTLEGLMKLRQYRYKLLDKMIRIDVPFPAIEKQLDLCHDVERRIHDYKTRRGL